MPRLTGSALPARSQDHLHLVPDLRTHTVWRYPVALAVIARYVTARAAAGARAGYRTARTELRAALPPHAVDTVLTAYRGEGRRPAADAKAAELVERALRGDASSRPGFVTRRRLAAVHVTKPAAAAEVAARNAGGACPPKSVTLPLIAAIDATWNRIRSFAGQ